LRSNEKTVEWVISNSYSKYCLNGDHWEGLRKTPLHRLGFERLSNESFVYRSAVLAVLGLKVCPLVYCDISREEERVGIVIKRVSASELSSLESWFRLGGWIEIKPTDQGLKCEQCLRIALAPLGLLRRVPRNGIHQILQRVVTILEARIKRAVQRRLAMVTTGEACAKMT
jgi:hypothetical protein